LVPVLYAIFVLDLKLVRWGGAVDAPAAADTPLDAAVQARPASGPSPQTASSVGEEGAVDGKTLGTTV